LFETLLVGKPLLGKPLPFGKPLWGLLGKFGGGVEPCLAKAPEGARF
jgi:hypothetical protein